MPKTVTLTLEEPIEGPRGLVKEIVLSEPKGALYLQLGEPGMVGRAADGALFQLDRDDVIQRYVEGCIVSPDDPLVVKGRLGLVDAMRAREVVLDFLEAAKRRLAQLALSSSSSSTSAGPTSAPSAT